MASNPWNIPNPKAGNRCSPTGHADYRWNMALDCVAAQKAYADITAHIGKACQIRNGVQIKQGTYDAKGVCVVRSGACQGTNPNFFYTYNTAGDCTVKGKAKVGQSCVGGSRTSPWEGKVGSDGMCVPGSTIDPGPGGSLGPDGSGTPAPSPAPVLQQGMGGIPTWALLAGGGIALFLYLRSR